MIIDDSSLAQFALGVAAASGVLLALLVSIIVFVLSRLKTDEIEAPVKIRELAQSLHTLLKLHPEEVISYFADLPKFKDFYDKVIQLSAAQSSDDIPDFVTEWQDQSGSIIQLVDKQRGNLDSNNKVLFSFHGEFTIRLWQLDLGIRSAYISVRVARSIAKKLRLASGIAGALLIGALGIALASFTHYSEGMPDSWNLLAGIVIIVFVIVLVYVFLYMIWENSKPAADVIDEAVARNNRLVALAQERERFPHQNSQSK